MPSIFLYVMEMAIPKIIHHIAPVDENVWHPTWRPCLNTWFKHFPEGEYKHIMWNDSDDIDSLVKDKFPEYWDYYKNLPFHIMKIDFSRYCILYEYGGIYSDMDLLCYENFFHFLDSDLILLESYPEFYNEFVINCLMIGSQKNKFFLDCIKESVKKYNEFGNNIPDEAEPYYVSPITGPLLISELAKKGYELKLLPKEYFNPKVQDREKIYYTRHMISGHWGRESIEENKINHQKRLKNLSFQEFLIHVYNDVEQIDLIQYFKEELEE